MDSTNSEDREILDKLERVAIEADPRPLTEDDLPVAIISNKGKVLSQLIAGSVTFPYKLKRQEYSTTFKEPIYINDVYLDLSSILASASIPLKLEYSGPFTRSKIVDAKKLDDHTVYFEIQDLVTGITLKPISFSAKEISLSGVRIDGWTQAALEKIAGKLDSYLIAIDKFDKEAEAQKNLIDQKLATLRANETASASRVEALKQQISTIEAQIPALEASKIAAEAEAKKATEMLTDIQSKTTAEIGTLSKLQTERFSIENSLDERKILSEKLTETIAKEKAELEIIRNDKALFPENMQGFSKQSRAFSLVYIGMSVIPLIIIGWVAMRLFESAEALGDIINTIYAADIYNILLARLPFTLVCLMLIHASYYLCKAFVLKVMSIHDDRLNLAKISILAKDISTTAKSDLDITDGQEYESRIALKMFMLREYFRGNILHKPDVDTNAHLEKAGKTGLLSKLSAALFERNQNEEAKRDIAGPK